MLQLSVVARAPFFSSLGEQELRALAEACRTRSFRRGDVLFYQGDPGNALYILRSGQVKVVLEAEDSEETILHIEGVGECLGELSLVDGAPRSATVVALDRVEALVLYREEFLAFVRRYPTVALAVMSGLAGMVRRLSGQVQDSVQLDVPGRLAKKLLELAERYGQPTPEGARINLHLTQHELAQMVGATRVSVNHHLIRFEEQRIVTVHRDGITIHRPDRLRQRICGRGTQPGRGLLLPQITRDLAEIEASEEHPPCRNIGTNEAAA